MNTPEKIIECLNNKFGKYKQPVTILSKTDENEFIDNDTEVFNWDDISKIYGMNEKDDSSSVDAIYFSLNNKVLTIYFFEFKRLNLHSKFFNAKKQLDDIIKDLDECVFCCCYPKQMRKVKKKLISRKVVSLKTKPIESLILLHNILNEFGIPSDQIVKIRKEYYIVSQTPMTGNPNNFHRQTKNREIFGFIDKISPFPFSKIDHLTVKSFLKMIDNLEEIN